MNWLAALLQTNDSMFPTGSYAHSFGLEGVVQRGLVSDEATLRTFLQETVMPVLEHVELPFVAHAYRGNLAELDEMYAAMKGARELREASTAVGTQRRQLLAQMYPQAGAVQAAHAPIVWGAQCAALDIPVEAALAAFYYQGIAGVLMAAPKLIRIGQTACQRLLTECLQTTDAAVTNARNVPREDIGWFAPLLDIASARHETAETRIFVS
jgi:urease accessory protein